MMTKYPLEWGWHTNSSAASDWKPKPTLLGSADPEAVSNDNNVKLAAAGDLKCQSLCASGGDYGTTATHRAQNQNMCRKCAVKQLGIESLPSSEQNGILERFEIKGR